MRVDWLQLLLFFFTLFLASIASYYAGIEVWMSALIGFFIGAVWPKRIFNVYSR